MPQPSNPASPQSPLDAQECQVSLRGVLRFEAVSLLGRLLFHRRPPSVETGPRLLNLGCGTNRYPEFVNADFYAVRSGRGQNNFWMVDLRYPLKCPGDYWDGVFTEHTLEHLYPNQALALLKELHRTMRPGAWVRVAVPDLAKYVSYYFGQPSHTLFQRWPLRAQAVRNLSQAHFHCSLWDVPLMSHYLYEAGFVKVCEQQYGQGADGRLLKDSPNRQWESLYVEAQR